MAWLKDHQVPQDLLEHLDEMAVMVKTLINDEETLYSGSLISSTIIFKLISQGNQEYQVHHRTEANQEVNINMLHCLCSPKNDL